MHACCDTGSMPPGYNIAQRVSYLWGFSDTCLPRLTISTTRAMRRTRSPCDHIVAVVTAHCLLTSKLRSRPPSNIRDGGAD